LKIAALLSQYLYTQKKLDLAGIGSFTLDPGTVIETDQKHGKTALLEGVSFTENASTKDDEGFIAFVSAQTGKMKALAAADVDSYLTLARQFLNIGKPFQIEGIGTLNKTRTGYEFTAGMMAEKLKEAPAPKETATAHSEESFIGYEDVFNNSTATARNKKRKLLLGSLTIAGLLLAIAAGFYISRSWNADATSTETANAVTNAADTATQTTLLKDTNAVNPAPVAPVVAAGSYKFIIEEAAKARALPRYEKLKKGNNNIQLETADSVNFRIYVILPATAADTTKKADSLSNIYPALNRKKAYVAAGR
jgi:hypothetical protein